MISNLNTDDRIIRKLEEKKKRIGNITDKELYSIHANKVLNTLLFIIGFFWVAINAVLIIPYYTNNIISINLIIGVFVLIIYGLLKWTSNRSREFSTNEIIRLLYIPNILKQAYRIKNITPTKDDAIGLEVSTEESMVDFEKNLISLLVNNSVKSYEISIFRKTMCILGIPLFIYFCFQEHWSIMSFSMKVSTLISLFLCVTIIASGIWLIGIYLIKRHSKLYKKTLNKVAKNNINDLYNIGYINTFDYNSICNLYFTLMDEECSSKDMYSKLLTKYNLEPSQLVGIYLRFKYITIISDIALIVWIICYSIAKTMGDATETNGLVFAIAAESIGVKLADTLVKKQMKAILNNEEKLNTVINKISNDKVILNDILYKLNSLKKLPVC